MENNPIKYTDLVSPDVEAGFDALIGKLEQLKTEGENACNAIKKGLSGAVASSANIGGASKPTQEVQTLIDAYKSLKVDVDMYKDAIDAVNKSERERKNVLSALQEVDRAREDSYDQLSAKYRALKILVNNLTEAERTNTEQGKKMVDDLRAMYEQMNALQQATGKYQLQVGNYSKAISGLNVATVQVMREMPALANSPATFAIAISNNIPILVDYIGKVRQLRVETLEQIKAAEAAGDAEKAASLKAEMAKNSNLKVTSLLAKSIFSWQTALLAVLTVLPIVLRKISAKNKAMKEGNDETKNAITYMNAMADAEKAMISENERSISRLKTVYDISQDVNRSWRERIEAGEALKKMYPEEFANFDAEAIALGNAKKSVDDLTNSLVKQATARAYLSEIEKLTIEKRNLTIKRDATQVTATEVKNYQEMLDLLEKYKKLLHEGGQGAEYEKAKKELTGPISRLYLQLEKELGKDYVQDIADYIETDIQIQEAESAIENLKKLISTDVLDDVVGESKGGGSKGEGSTRTWGSKIAKVNEDIFGDYVQREKDVAEAARSIRDIAIRDEYEQRKAAGEDILSIKKLRDAKLLESEKRYWQDYLKLLTESGTLTLEEYEKIKAKLQSFDRGEAKIIVKTTETPSGDSGKRKKSKKFGGVVEALFAFSDTYGYEDENEARQVQEKYRSFAQSVDSALNKSIGYMEDWMDARVQMAEIAVECAEKEMESAKTSLDYEMQARANGYANSVETAQKEYEEKRKLTQRAEEDLLELQRVQELADTAQQISSLLTASANIWSSHSSLGPAGVPMAIAAIATMWTSFGAAKVKAAQLSKAQTETYGEGMSEYLDYGGSHSSGHDIDFGTTKNGTRRRVERGEMIGVINKRNVRKYGVNKVSDIISSLNHGDFENKYGNAFAGVEMINGSGADLTRLERGVNSLVEQGNTKVVNVNGKTITMYKNTKRIIRS
jgi:hypothetical protein